MDLRTSFAPEAGDLPGISLCAGYAGIDLSLHIAEPTYRTVAFVERESHAAAALVARMEDEALAPAPIWDDLKTFDGRPWRGRVRVLTAGYPCQPFSFSGKRQGESDPRHLFPDIARIVAEVEPEWVFCENVEGHLTLGFADVVRRLQSLGYSTNAGLFTAREAGASHRRRRLFLLAHADGMRRRLHSGPIDRERPGEVSASATSSRDARWTTDPARKRGACLDGFLQLEHEIPLFAPSPSELSAWAAIATQRPGLQPAILRTGDGLADRVDRTRAAGNGVCSLAAALAWAVLKSAHQIRRDMNTPRSPAPESG